MVRVIVFSEELLLGYIRMKGEEKKIDFDRHERTTTAVRVKVLVGIKVRG